MVPRALRFHRGFLLIDALAGLAIVGMIATALAVAVYRQHDAAHRFAERRAAVRTAERVLTDLQRGVAPADQSARVVPVEAASPHGYRWVRVEVDYLDRHVQLLGLAPRTNPEAGP